MFMIYLKCLPDCFGISKVLCDLFEFYNELRLGQTFFYKLGKLQLVDA